MHYFKWTLWCFVQTHQAVLKTEVDRPKPEVAATTCQSTWRQSMPALSMTLYSQLRLYEAHHVQPLAIWLFPLPQPVFEIGTICRSTRLHLITRRVQRLTRRSGLARPLAARCGCQICRPSVFGDIGESIQPYYLHFLEFHNGFLFKNKITNMNG